MSGAPAPRAEPRSQVHLIPAAARVLALDPEKLADFLASWPPEAPKR